VYSQRQHEHILKGFTENVNNKSFMLSGTQSLVTDVIAYLLDIVSPRVRQGPFTSLSAQEKITISSIVSVMASVGLRYIPTSAHKTSTPTHAVPMSLEPALDSLVDGFKRFAVNALRDQVADRNVKTPGTDKSGADWGHISNRRHVLSHELRGALANELKEFLAAARAEEVLIPHILLRV
jgi:hypothetical protein